jgi:hypothetical protein
LTDASLKTLNDFVKKVCVCVQTFCASMASQCVQHIKHTLHIHAVDVWLRNARMPVRLHGRLQLHGGAVRPFCTTRLAPVVSDEATAGDDEL